MFLIVGEVVRAALLHPQNLNSKRIRFTDVYNEPISEWLAELSDYTGKPVKLLTTPYEIVKARYKPAADTFACQQEFGYYPAESGLDLLEASTVVKRALTSWPEWLRSSKWAGQLKSA